MITPYSIAKQYIDIKEISGAMNNPIIMAMLKLDNNWPENDEVPWCSAFINWVAFNAGVWRSKSLMARSWLAMVNHIQIDHAEQGWDVVILSRGHGEQPSAGVLNAPGHVGLYSFHNGGNVWLLGGNQSDSVSIQKFPKSRIIGVRRWNH